MRAKPNRRLVHAFLDNLVVWLKEQKFIIGPPADDIKMDSVAVDEASGWLGLIANAFSISLPKKFISTFLTSGGSSDQVEQAMFPYLDNADLVALHVGGNVTVVPVIWADGVSADEILECFHIFIVENQGLSNLGMRFILSSTSPAIVYVYPLLVYSNSEEALANWNLIKDQAWYSHPQVALRAAWIDIANPHIQWAEPNTEIYRKHKIVLDQLNAIGHKDFPLNNAVVTELVRKARPPEQKTATNKKARKNSSAAKSATTKKSPRTRS